MPRQFDGQLCVLCRERPSSREGEHVWTEWFLSMFPESEGPYTRLINGEAERTRDGVTVRKHTAAERVKVPCCTICNGKLDERFEKLAKPIVRVLFESDGAVSLTTLEANTLGFWLLKTRLLLAHPRALSSMPGRTPQRWDLSQIPDDPYTWMITGAEPPPGLSLWAAREDASLTLSDEPRRLPLPTIVADGPTIRFQTFRCSVRFLDVTLVYHPGWEIAHPLESEGRAVRLWPSAGSAVDFHSLSPVAPRDTVWVEGPTLHFVPGYYGRAELPPIDGSQDFLFSCLAGAVVFASAPRLASTA